MKKNSATARSLKTTKFSSVQDLVKATAASTVQITEFEKTVKSQQIVNELIAARASANMTQADVAAKMNCTQSAVSKLEHSTDAEINFHEVAKYLEITASSLHIILGKQPTQVERIKYFANGLKNELNGLADLSKNSDDPGIRTKIHEFFGETWFNLLNILCDSSAKLPKKSKSSSALRVVNTQSRKSTLSPSLG